MYSGHVYFTQLIVTSKISGAVKAVTVLHKGMCRDQ